jgi:MFS family permease
MSPLANDNAGPQGKLLGYFGSAGSLARVIFPILAGVLTEYYGEKPIFVVMSILLLLSCAVFVRFRETIREVIS